MLKLILGKVVGGLLLPPTCIVLSLVLGLWLLRRRPRLGYYWMALTTLAFFLLSTPWVGNRLLHAMESVRAVRPPYAHQAQAIVVLGGGTFDYAPEWGGPTLSHMSLERLRYAAHLHRQTGLPLLVTGGKPNNHIAEGVIMAAALERDFSVKARWIEDQALDTEGNAEYSMRLLRAAGITRAYVVSHPWHLPRALPQFEGRGLQAVPAPTAYTPVPDFGPLSALPSGFGALCSYLAFREAVGRAAYAVSDWLD